MRLPDISGGWTYWRTLFLSAWKKRRYSECEKILRNMNGLLPADRKVIMDVRADKNYEVQLSGWLEDFERELDRYRRDYMA